MERKSFAFAGIGALAMLAIISGAIAILSLNGNLAYVVRDTFTTNAEGIGEVKCHVVEYRGADHLFTSVNGRRLDGPFYHNGAVTVDTQIMGGGSNSTIGSHGYVSYGPYAPGENDPKNSVGWACQKEAYKTGKFINLM